LTIHTYCILYATTSSTFSTVFMDPFIAYNGHPARFSLLTANLVRTLRN